MTRRGYHATLIPTSESVHPVHLVYLLVLLLTITGCSNTTSREQAPEGRSAAEETITSDDIGVSRVGSPDIINETILAEDIAVGAVTSDEILNETIVSEDLAVGSVNSRVTNWVSIGSEVADGVRTSSYSPPPSPPRGSISSRVIEDESVVVVDLADVAVTNHRVAPGPAFHGSPVDRLNRKNLLTQSSFANVNTTFAAKVLTGEVLSVLDTQDTTPLQQPVLALPAPIIPENNFRSATTSPFSTFSIEVVTLLQQGRFALALGVSSLHLFGSLLLTWLGLRTLTA